MSWLTPLPHVHSSSPASFHAYPCFYHVIIIIIINIIVIGTYLHGHNCSSYIAYRAILNGLSDPNLPLEQRRQRPEFTAATTKAAEWIKRKDFSHPGSGSERKNRNDELTIN